MEILFCYFKDAEDIIEISAELPNQYFLEMKGLANRFDAVSFNIAALLSECARSSSVVPKGLRGSS